MKRLWEWAQENSSTLRGIAAIVVIVGAIATTISLVARGLRPDLVVRVAVYENTIPPDLDNILMNVSSLSMDYPALERLRNYRSSRIFGAFDKAQIEIINQTDDAISGVRVRFDDIHSLWEVDIGGTFLQKGEAERFRESVEAATGQAVVLPELPSIPPNSSIMVTLFGKCRFLQPAVTVEGHSYSIKRVIEVEQGVLTRLYLNLFPSFLIIVAILFTAFLPSGPVWTMVRRHIVKNETKNILYDRACKLALDGEADSAMVFLRQAVGAGYSDRQHALKDEDLESLRERVDFKELLRKTQAS